MNRGVPALFVLLTVCPAKFSGRHIITIPQDMQGVSFKELVEKGKTPRDWRKSLY